MKFRTRIGETFRQLFAAFFARVGEELLELHSRGLFTLTALRKLLWVFPVDLLELGGV